MMLMKVDYCKAIVHYPRIIIIIKKSVDKNLFTNTTPQSALSLLGEQLIAV